MGVSLTKTSLVFPKTWDPAHLLNLAVTNVKDQYSPAGSYFRLFINRSNIFNHLLSHGRGFGFFQSLGQNTHRPISYPAQRLASSSYNQWIKIYKSYNSYIETFETLHPNRKDDEEWQYMVKCSDYVNDLLSLLDTMKPLVDVMFQMQSLDCPIWKLKKIWATLFKRLTKTGKFFFALFYKNLFR